MKNTVHEFTIRKFAKQFGWQTKKFGSSYNCIMNFDEGDDTGETYSGSFGIIPDLWFLSQADSKLIQNGYMSEDIFSETKVDLKVVINELKAARELEIQVDKFYCLNAIEVEDANALTMEKLGIYSVRELFMDGTENFVLRLFVCNRYGAMMHQIPLFEYYPSTVMRKQENESLSG